MQYLGMRAGHAVAIAEGLEYNSIASVANLSGNSLMDASEELGRALQVKSHSLHASLLQQQQRIVSEALWR